MRVVVNPCKAPQPLRWAPLAPRPLKCCVVIASATEDVPVSDVGASTNGAEGQYAPPPAYPMYQPPPQHYQAVAPVAPPPQPAASGGTPFWVWIILGAAGAWVIGKIQEFRKNPFAAMAGMAGAMGGKAPPGMAGGADMAKLMEMMQQQMQQQPRAQQVQQAGRPGGSPMPMGSTINTTAAEVTPGSSFDRDGSKFEQNKQQAASPSPSANSTPSMDAPPAQPAAPSSFFSDSSSSQQAAPAASSFFSDSSQAKANGSSASDDANTEKLMEDMLDMVVQSPELQKQLYQHLPESMRNESTWQWVRDNPEIKKQLAKQMAPAMKEQYGDLSQMLGGGGGAGGGGVDYQAAMQQMKAQGINPDDMMQKMYSDEELMQLMTKPHVTEALLDIQKNPQNALKYMSDPDVSKLMQKMMAMNPMGAGMPMPGQ